jgi:hypothetical protein
VQKRTAATTTRPFRSAPQFRSKLRGTDEANGIDRERETEGSAAIVGNAGRYVSIANGPTADSKPRTMAFFA